MESLSRCAGSPVHAPPGWRVRWKLPRKRICPFPATPGRPWTTVLHTCRQKVVGDRRGPGSGEGHRDAAAWAGPSGHQGSGWPRRRADCAEGGPAGPGRAPGPQEHTCTHTRTHTCAHTTHTRAPHPPVHAGEKGDRTLRAEACWREGSWREPQRAEGAGPGLCRPSHSVSAVLALPPSRPPRAPRGHRALVGARPRCRPPCPGRPCSAASAAVSPCTSG